MVAVVTLPFTVVAPLLKLPIFTVLPKLVMPVVVVVKLKLPLNAAADPKVIVLLPDEVNVVAASNVTGLLYVCAPLVVSVPCNCVAPPAFTVKLVKPLMFEPFKVVVPLKPKVKLLLPPMMLVLLNVVPDKVTLLPKVSAP